MRQIPKIWRAIREMGPGWILARGYYEFSLRSGLHRWRFPPRPWSDYTAEAVLRASVRDPETLRLAVESRLSQVGWGRFERERYRNFRALLTPEDGQARLVAANRIVHGIFPYFTREWIAHGSPPRWEWNPKSGVDWKGRYYHWSQVSPWSKELGDLKYVWEIGRFSYVFTLVRAYASSGDEVYPECFWHLVEDWARGNPPNSTIHWKCGQETAMRLVAWLFGFFAFFESPSATADRILKFFCWVSVQADRIEKDTLYAHLQQNNHSMSEGMGLLAVGTLLPELASAERWRRVGLDILEKEGLALIRPDGTFRQKAHNYHRLMLQIYSVSTTILKSAGGSLSTALQERLARAADYLFEVMDADSGRCPNFGSNDGALLLPLNDCDYEDFRPVVQAAQCIFRQRKAVPFGAWDEDLFWLGEVVGAKSEARLAARSARASFDWGGIYTHRSDQSWVFIHAEDFKDRPSHADTFHLDFWWNGINLACDPGTYLYYGVPPWNNGLLGTGVHNTVQVNDLDQMERGPRFMWVNWLRTRKVAEWERGETGITYQEFCHDGYTRLDPDILHYRGILKLPGDGWVILDRLSGSTSHCCRLHWLLADLPFDTRETGRLLLKTPKGPFQIWCASDRPGGSLPQVVKPTSKDAVEGWISPNYGALKPGLSISLKEHGALPMTFLTVFAPGDDFSVRWEESDLRMAYGVHRIAVTIRSKESDGMIAPEGTAASVVTLGSSVF